MKFKIMFLCTILASAPCFAAPTTNLIYFPNTVSMIHPQVATDPTATLVLTKPIHDVNQTAGTKMQGQFQSEDIAGLVEVRLVKTFSDGTVDMSVQYVVGNVAAKSFGKNKYAFILRADIPAGDYGIFLFGTNAMTGEPIHSVSSPTVQVLSSLYHPGPNSVVRKGKELTIRWKGKAPGGVDLYDVRYQDNTSAEPIDLGTVSSDRNSFRVMIPESAATEGRLMLIGKAWEIDGNWFRLK